MDTPAYSDPDPRAADRRKSFRTKGFSLVEIALALGIMAFALVAIFGLMPLGMTTFKKAMDLSVGSQIAQRVIGDAQQSDFETLIDPQGAVVAAGGVFAKQPYRYFDDQGQEGVAAQAGMVYVVNTRVVPSTSMPGGGSATTVGVQNANIATVTVQVANNPGQIALTPDATTRLWSPSNGVAIATFSTFIARNSSSTASTTP